MRRLSERELNRAVLARQCLLERAGAPIPRVLERVGGIQAQYAPSMYVGLWSRLAGFARDDLTRALERRSAVQATLMRVTIHLVSRRDHGPLARAVRAARRALWLGGRRGGPGEEEMAAAAAALRPRLAAGPIARAELEATLGKDVANGIGLWVDLVRAPPSGTWERRRADLYAGAEEWLGPSGTDGDGALDHLVRRYLGAFGPASRADLASWSGLPPTALDPALARLRLRRFLGPGETVLLDLPRAPLPDPATPAPPRFLPTWDAALLVHCRRAGILREEHRPRIFSVRNPHSLPVFLVDGVVAGTWRHADGEIRLEPFGRLAAADRRALAEEAEGLAALHA